MALCHAFGYQQAMLKWSVGRSDINHTQCVGAKSSVDDLTLGRGVVTSWAATILRATETHPFMTGRFVSIADILYIRHLLLTYCYDRLIDRKMLRPVFENIHTLNIFIRAVVTDAQNNIKRTKYLDTFNRGAVVTQKKTQIWKDRSVFPNLRKLLKKTWDTFPNLIEQWPRPI